MSTLLWEFISFAYAPLRSYGALIDGSALRIARTDEAGKSLVA